jgi:hypothetical protein
MSEPDHSEEFDRLKKEQQDRIALHASAGNSLQYRTRFGDLR